MAAGRPPVKFRLPVGLDYRLVGVRGTAPVPSGSEGKRASVSEPDRPLGIDYMSLGFHATLLRRAILSFARRPHLNFFNLITIANSTGITQYCETCDAVRLEHFQFGQGPDKLATR